MDLEVHMGTGEQGEEHEQLRGLEPHGDGHGDELAAHEEATDLSTSMELNGGASLTPSLPSMHTISGPYVLHHPLVMIAPPQHSSTENSDAMQSFIPPELLQQLRQEFAEERAQLKRQLETLRQEILDNYEKRQRTCMEEEADGEGEEDDGDENRPLGGMAEKRRNNEERYLNVPVYMLSSEVKTVRDLWTEYTVGWKGGPAIKDLNDRFGSRWRRTTVARQHWCRRESVIREIKNRTRLAYQHKRRAAGLADGAEWAPGSQEDNAPMDYMVAVMDLEKYMSENHLTLNQLARQLKRASVAAHAAHAQAHVQIHAHAMAQAMALEYPHGHMPPQQEGGVEGELQPMQLSDHTEPHHHHHHEEQQQPQDGLQVVDHHSHHAALEMHRHHSLHDGHLDPAVEEEGNHTHHEGEHVHPEGQHTHHLHPPPPYDAPEPPSQQQHSHDSMIAIL